MSAARAEQLALPLAHQPGERPDTDAQRLARLADALRLLLAIADGELLPSSASLRLAHDALDVVVTFGPGGRLGHVVRRFSQHPPAVGCWSELATELEFAANLCVVRAAS
jgi:hypothetical protein